MISFILVSIFVYESESGKLTVLFELYLYFKHYNNISKFILITSISIYDYPSNISNFNTKVHSIK